MISPDEKTILAYREVLVELRLLDKLFKKLDKYLEEKGLFAEMGHIVDATIVEVPKQRKRNY